MDAERPAMPQGPVRGAEAAATSPLCSHVIAPSSERGVTNADTFESTRGAAEDTAWVLSAAALMPSGMGSLPSAPVLSVRERQKFAAKTPIPSLNTSGQFLLGLTYEANTKYVTILSLLIHK